MIRHMSGDVGLSFQKTLKELYKEEDGSITKVGESCCKWHWIVVKYAVNPYMMRGYVSLIQTAFENGVDLDRLKSWKRLMRVILPEEFLMKMNDFTTQVPKIAIMDDQHGELKEKKRVRDASEVSW